MPVIKAVFTATASAPVASGGVVTTTVNPVVTRYFSAVTAAMIGATETTIPAANFVDDANAAIVALPPIGADEYFNVYVNGVLQQNSLSTLTTASLVLNTIDVLEGTPVILEIGNFTNTSSSITTQPTISAPTITIIT